MKISGRKIKQFNKDRKEWGMTEAIEFFQQDVANQLLSRNIISDEDMQQEIDDYGPETALHNLQFRMAGKLLEDCGLKTEYEK